VTFRTKKEFNLHKILRAIDSNVILSKLIETDYCRTSETMVPLKELLEKFNLKIIENTECIIAECNFEFNLKHKKQNILYRTVEKMICNY
jgi:DNA polymerase-3 subunit alpha/error-prone DNA polymerase